MNTPQQLHIPVLLDQVISLLEPKKGERYLDLTAGYGGHASAIFSRTLAPENSVLVDRDPFAVAHLAKFQGQGAQILNTDFLSATQDLASMHAKFDMILLDLGISSPQLDRAERGFSFLHDGLLDMRMDERQKLTAAEIVNYFPEREIAKIIREYGEENPKMAAKIAREIVFLRKKRKIATTLELAEIVAKVKPRRGKINPATQTFQAIRIAVNDELGQVKNVLPLLPKILADGGRLAIISFHSLEDRLVKQFFKSEKEAGIEAELKILTPRPITENNDYNPRSRSAKLRVAAKLNKNRKE